MFSDINEFNKYLVGKKFINSNIFTKIFPKKLQRCNEKKNREKLIPLLNDLSNFASQDKKIICGETYYKYFELNAKIYIMEYLHITKYYSCEDDLNLILCNVVTKILDDYLVGKYYKIRDVFLKHFKLFLNNLAKPIYYHLYFKSEVYGGYIIDLDNLGVINKEMFFKDIIFKILIAFTNYNFQDINASLFFKLMPYLEHFHKESHIINQIINHELYHFFKCVIEKCNYDSDDMRNFNQIIINSVLENEKLYSFIISTKTCEHYYRIWYFLIETSIILTSYKKYLYKKVNNEKLIKNTKLYIITNCNNMPLVKSVLNSFYDVKYYIYLRLQKKDIINTIIAKNNIEPFIVLLEEYYEENIKDKNIITDHYHINNMNKLRAKIINKNYNN